MLASGIALSFGRVSDRYRELSDAGRKKSTLAVLHFIHAQRDQQGGIGREP
jgi:hypothetical protein